MGKSTFIPTRAAALKRLKAFLPRAGRDYQRERNFDRGPGQHHSVSMLSPYIRHRVVSESEVVAATLAQHNASAADKFLQEVFWRSYWKGWLEHRPKVWQRYLDELNQAFIAMADEPGLMDRYQQACSGATSIEPFDAWVSELIDTGYLHNHARMWFASIWIFTLNLPWVLGADLFLRHLLDGDAASNTLSWRWVAGLHTKGKTYLTTPGNLEKYASSRFFSSGPPAGLTELARSADALTEAPLPPAKFPALPEEFAPAPNSGLLLHDDDLLLSAPFEPSAVAAWLPAPATPVPLSEQVRSFKQTLAEDALIRANNRWADADVARPLDDCSEIIAWAAQNNLKEVVVPYSPCGAVRDQLDQLEQLLAEDGRRLTIFVRAFDREVWPHSSRGFFALKKQIPALVEQLGLSQTGDGQLQTGART